MGVMNMKFNETKSQERLINLMFQAGVEWPDAATHAMQSGLDGYILFSKGKPERCHDGWAYQSVSTPILFTKPLPNWHQTIITREQYEARDGWITWHGGECPVNGEVEVMVMLESGNMGGERHGGKIRKSRDWCWSVLGQYGIIAYRIHKPTASEPCESVKTCTPDQPTIEQLVVEWSNQKVAVSKAFDARAAAQELYEDEREKAKQAEKRVQDKLAELGWPADAKQEPEQLVITDWRDLRVGDVVYFSESTEVRVTDFGECKIINADYGCERQPFYVEFTSGFCTWPNLKFRDWKFIRRP